MMMVSGVPSNEIWYYAPEKVTLYSSSGVQSHEFSGGKGILTFKSPVTALNTWFRGIATISEICVPDGIVTISASACQGCSGLEKINLGEISSLGNDAFYGCTSLSDCGKGIFGNTIIDSCHYFHGCTSLKQALYFPNATEIKLNNYSSSFRQFFNSGITELHFPNLTTITQVHENTGIGQGSVTGGSFASQSPNLKIVDLGVASRWITPMFVNCPSLEEVRGYQYVTEIGRSTFRNSGLNNKDLIFPECTTLIGTTSSQQSDVFHGCLMRSIKLPKLVSVPSFTSYGYFRNCPNLIYIEFGEYLTSIESGGWSGSNFSGCPLKTIVIKNPTPPIIGVNSLRQTTELSYIVVPKLAENDYKTAEYWSTFASKIVGYLEADVLPPDNTEADAYFIGNDCYVYENNAWVKQN